MFPHIKEMARVIDSDAHNLWTLSEGVNTLELDDEPYSSDTVRRSLFRYLRGEK